MSAGAVVGRYAKAIEAGFGVALMAGSAAVELASHAVPSPWIVATQAVLGGMTVFRVWLVKNEPLIEQAVTAVENVVHDVEHKDVSALVATGAEIGGQYEADKAAVDALLAEIRAGRHAAPTDAGAGGGGGTVIVPLNDPPAAGVTA